MGLKNFKVLPVAEIISGLIKDHKKEIAAKQLVVVNTFPEHVKINGHALGMKQVLENLLSNAIKFSEQNGEIHFLGNTENNCVQIIIKDHGTGFNERTKQTLFSKFVPDHLGTNGEPTTGLGLYLTKEIVEKHGDTIESYSDGQGKGAQFVVSISA